ncbi:putative U box domain, armadillo-like helical, Zinc finger, RING/FYVE/PHD-type [Helianthus annuus]|nr:putative U box domain, armadillo-like helical, Zinc finger, RING/FYVE/PHD-type [Helianthus annuus]
MFYIQLSRTFQTLQPPFFIEFKLSNPHACILILFFTIKSLNINKQQVLSLSKIQNICVSTFNIHKMEDDMVEVPRFFICPISLQIMKDPVTAVTGITYDRDSIEHWLSTAEVAQCPVTKQSLTKDSDLTPNHTLRRLIQAWCVTNASYGVDRIPTPKPVVTKSHVMKLLRNLKSPELYLISLNALHLIASENQKNRQCLIESGTTGAMISFITKLCKETSTRKVVGLGQALSILHLTWQNVPEKKKSAEFKQDHDQFIDSLLWVLASDNMIEDDVVVEVQTRAISVLGMVMEISSTSVLERLKFEFFKQTVNVIRKRTSPQAVKAALRMLIDVCPWGRNRMKIVEAGAVFELVELELNGLEKNVSELVFGLLAQLCSCADGRAQLLKHACGIAMVAKRMFRVSPGTDDRAVHILLLIGRFSATDEVVAELLRVGAVSKLCMVLQVDYAPYIKKKAREILRLHSNVWNNSPCMPIYIQTK